MNSELQAQTDAVVNAIKQLETTLHQDILFAMFVLGTIIIVIGIVVDLFRK